MKLKKSIIALLLFFVCFKAFAQANTSLEGTWKGTSLCQIKSSPCHDEIAVYHIAKTDKPNMFQMTINKMVNNKEEDMGILIFSYDASTKTLSYNDDKRDAQWKFSIKGSTMEGQLVYKKQLYRIIKVKKENVK